ncbi:hypothetical protein GCM10025776_29980 [Corallincola platygyrae]
MAEELTPRRWSHLPVDMNFLGAAYVYSDVSVDVDPVLQLEDVTADIHTVAARYIRSFSLFDRTARISVGQGFQEAKWRGILDGERATAKRDGSTDTIVRFAVNLYGAPALSGKEYRQYRIKQSQDSEFIFGAGLSVQLPTGDYMESKLINIGSNRYTFRPQFGGMYRNGPWSLEGTAVAAIYTENDEFWDGNKLEEEPLYSARGHLIYDFMPGVWASASVLHNYGGRPKVNGITKDSEKQNTAWALSVGFPINKHLGVKLAYVGSRTHKDTGVDSDSFALGISTFW